MEKQITDTLSTLAGVPEIGNRILSLVIVLFVLSVLFVTVYIKMKESDNRNQMN
jgi:hypothetical protein